MTDPTKYNACRDAKGKICRAEFVSGPDDDGAYYYHILDEHLTEDWGRSSGQGWSFNEDGFHWNGNGLQLLHIPEQDDLTALAAIAERNPDWGITLPVDEAELQEARECAALVYEREDDAIIAQDVRAGKEDCLPSVQSVLTYIKRQREASQ